MRDIVQESELSAGAIYNLFSSKHEIIAAIAARRHDEERRLFEEALKQATVAKSLKAIRDHFLRELNSPKQRMRRRVTVQTVGGGPARLNVTESGKGYLCKTIQPSSRPSHRGAAPGRNRKTN
jgi:AcrR family transcriptional regulator